MAGPYCEITFIVVTGPAMAGPNTYLVLSIRAAGADRERNAGRLRIGRLVDALAVFDLEGASNAIAGRIFEDGESQQLVRASAPWLFGSEDPACFTRFGPDVALERGVVRLHAERTHQEPFVQWLGERHGQRFATPGGWRADAPR